MFRRSKNRLLAAVLAASVVVAVALALAVATLIDSAEAGRVAASATGAGGADVNVTSIPTPAEPIPARAADRTVTVGHRTLGVAIPPGFVGLSVELPTLLSYAGHDPAAVDPVLEQLVRNLAPGQRPVLRIGGDSTDWTWFPVPGMKRPPWVRYTLTTGWTAVAHALATALDARLILGINLEANSARIADAEAAALVDGIGAGSVEAFELGNEPELYGSFDWYRTKRGTGVRGRGPGYDFAAFSRQFATISRTLRGAPLAGPSIGSPVWSQQLRLFLGSNRKVAVITLHRYPLKRCKSTTHVTSAQLTSEDASVGLGGAVAPYVRTAHQYGHRLRIDEINSISCGGQHGLSDTFASALWSLDALFALARSGVDGVNFHTVPNAVNQLFALHQTHGQWTGRVYPIYYGLLMFSQAAPPGSRLLSLTGTTNGPVRAWATRAPDRRVRVVLINTRPARSELVAVHAPAASGTASLMRLTAPRLTATSGITLGGQGFGSATTSGLPAGADTTTVLRPTAGVYLVRLPAASAAMLTFAP